MVVFFFAEAYRRWASQEMSFILWNPKVYCRVHKSLYLPSARL